MQTFIGQLDARTLSTLVVMVQVGIAATMILVLAIRRTEPGFSLWTLAAVSASAGFALFTARGALPDWISVLGANYLALSTPCLIYDGLRAYYRRRPSGLNPFNHGFVLSCLAILAFFSYVHPDDRVCIVLLNAAQIFLGLRIASVPFRFTSRPRSPDFVVPMAFLMDAALAASRLRLLATAERELHFVLDDMGFRAAALVVPIIGIISMAGFLLLTHQRIEDELSAAREGAELLSNLDRLTGIWNRRFFEAEAAKEISRVNRYGTALSAILFDADHFKAINDHFGHGVGDGVLVRLAEIVSSSLRSSDLLCRWGGEEFIVLLPTAIEGATATAEKLREAVATAQFETVPGLTISMGVAQYHPGEQLDSWLTRADKALYRAKANGRNRVEVDDSPIQLTLQIAELGVQQPPLA